MDLFAALITIVAGVAMGAINNVAGGAGIFALWAFQYACGLPLAVANPSSRLGAIGVGLFAWLGFRRAGIRPPASVWRLALFAVPGAFAGNLLALKAPDLWFRIYLAVVLLLLIVRQLRQTPKSAAAAVRPWLGPIGAFAIGVHMGFAQVGTGFVAALVLLSCHSRDFVTTNVAKSVIVISSSIASLLGFVLAPLLLERQAPVIAWGPAACLAVGTATGSYLASHWTVNKGSAVVQRVVLAIAALSLLDQVVQIALLVSAA
ncbi:MAG: sulfite exporter TauE/SafE family protein [Planctomycetes bacterium]|nr:sulfite exporter TauE/SafE family protein [Planctomycetota bacterium]